MHQLSYHRSHLSRKHRLLKMRHCGTILLDVPPIYLCYKRFYPDGKMVDDTKEIVVAVNWPSGITLVDCACKKPECVHTINHSNVEDGWCSSKRLAVRSAVVILFVWSLQNLTMCFGRFHPHSAPLFIISGVTQTQRTSPLAQHPEWLGLGFEVRAQYLGWHVRHNLNIFHGWLGLGWLISVFSVEWM